MAIFVASAIVPVVNTALFIVGCLLMTNSVYAMAGTQNVLIFICVSLVTFNFFIELAINLIVAPTLNRVLKIIKLSLSVQQMRTGISTHTSVYWLFFR